MTRRDLTLAVIYAATGCAALGALTLAYGTKAAVPYGALPAIAAATLLLWTLSCWPRSRGRLARPLALVGGLSLITTAVSDPPATPGGSVWRLAEMAVLLVLLAVVARWVPLRQAKMVGAGGGGCGRCGMDAAAGPRAVPAVAGRCRRLLVAARTGRGRHGRLSTAGGTPPVLPDHPDPSLSARQSFGCPRQHSNLRHRL